MRNLALACEQAFARARIIAKWRGVAPILLVSILPVYNGVNICERNGCHAPLFSDYFSASKCLFARKCDVVVPYNLNTFNVLFMYS